MLATTRQVSIARHDSPLGWWELVSTDIDPRLGGLVASWCGFREWTAGPSRRREVPSGIVPLIIDFSSAYRVAGPRDSGTWATFGGGFVAGVHESHALTESLGLAAAMQVNFTPLGAYRCLGVAMSALTNRTVGLDDLFGASAGRLVDRLENAPDWETRFDLLEAWLLDRLTGAPSPSPAVVWAWHELSRRAGRVAIGGLARQLGCSRKHLAARFREQIGVPPKTAARILRFERAVRLLQRQADPDGAEVALACGYFDQPHFIREFRQFAGVTPLDFVRHRILELGGVAAD